MKETQKMLRKNLGWQVQSRHGDRWVREDRGVHTGFPLFLSSELFFFSPSSELCRRFVDRSRFQAKQLFRKVEFLNQKESKEDIPP